MKLKHLLLTALAALSIGNVFAQKDITSTYIKNSELADLSYWKADGFGGVANQALSGKSVEAYAGWGSIETAMYSLTQEITLPEGSYRLVGNALFRQGAAYSTNPAKSLAFLKAGSNAVALKTLGSETAKAYANSQAEGAGVFSAGMYVNTLDFQVGEGGETLEIGYAGTFDEAKSWCVVSGVTLYDMNEAPTTADYTSMLANPSFENGTEGWTVDGQWSEQSNSEAVKIGTRYVEKWQATGGLPDAKISQTVTGLPNGTYCVTVSAIQTGNGSYVYANEVMEEPSKTASILRLEDVKVTDGTLEVGFVRENTTSNWVGVDNFRIYCVEFESPEPVIDQLVLINGEDEFTLNTHSAVSVEAMTAMAVSFDAAVKTASYSIQPIVGYDEQTGDPILGVPTWGELSINTTGYSERNYTFKQGTQYMITIEATLMDDTKASEQFIVNGAQVAEPLPATVTVDGKTLNVTYSVGTDLGDNYAVKPYILDANEQKIEVADYYIDNTTGGFFDPLNLIGIELNEELADGEYNVVLPAGMFIVNGADNNDEWSYEFTIGDLPSDVQIVPSFLFGEDEITLNDHSNVTVEEASAIKANFGDNAAMVKYATYVINELVEDEFMGVVDTLENEIASGILNINTIGYAEFENTLVFNYGSKYNVYIKAWDSEDIFTEDFSIKDPIATITCKFNGSYIEPFISEAAIVCDGEETTLNSHSEVSVEQAEAVAAKVSSEVRQVYYVVRNMKVTDGEESTEWVATDTIAAGEMSINGTAYAELDNELTFNAGSKYQITIKALDMDQNEQTAQFIINGSYVEPLIANGDFAKGNVGDVNIATYEKDGTPSQMQEVPGWTIGVANGDARAAGVVAYGSKTTLGGSSYTVPAAGPEGTNGNALAVVGVWTGTVKYVQDITLPAGKYTMTVPVFNTAGTNAFVKNLIGVTVDGVETLATAKSYPVGKWTNETVVFELAEESTVTLSLGYEGANVGSGASQHLFYDCVKIEEFDELAVAKAAALAALPVAGESIFTPAAADVDAVKTAIEAATTVAEIDSLAATVFDIPALSCEYAILNTSVDMYINGAIIAGEPAAVTFEKAQGGFYIKMGEEYLNMAGGNTWSINTAAEAKTVWNFTLADGAYTIQGPNGSIGVDYGIKAADNTDTNLYGNKNGNGTTWTIEEYVAPIMIETALINGEEENELNTKTSISLDVFNAIKVNVINAPEALGVSYNVFEMVQEEDSLGTFFHRGQEIAAGEAMMNTIAYAELDSAIYLAQGTKYEIDITVYGGNPAEPMEIANATYSIDGAYAEAMEIEVALINGEEENTINSHSAVSVDAANAIKVNVINIPEAIGITYLINEMKYVEEEEGSFWTVGAELASGESNLNGIAYAELDSTLYFAQGTKYQVSVSVLDQDLNEIAIYKYEINGSFAEAMEIEVALINGEEENTINSHSAVSVDAANAIKVNVINPSEMIAGISYNIFEMVQDEDSLGTFFKRGSEIAAGESNLNGIAYAEFDSTLVFVQGTKYQIDVTLYGVVDSTSTAEIGTYTYEINGSFDVNAPAAIPAFINGEEEIALNSHANVSVEAATALKVNFENMPEAIGATYAINVMNMHEDEEGIFWTVGAEVAVGEMSLNSIAYAEFENALTFEYGKKYQLTVTAFANSADPTEIGTYTFEFNGAYEEAEIAVENEQTPAVDALDGLTFVITDVNGVNTLTACHTSHPAGEQDMFSFNLNEYNGDQYVYCKFAKVADNKYTIQMHNAAAEYYALWNEHGYMNFQTPGKNVVFALGLNGDQLGQDGENCGVWEIAAVEGGYTMKNVGNGGYYNPAVAAPSAEPVVVKFWKNVKGEENAAIVGINSIATASKANGKYIENGKVVIVKNGVKYNVAGSIIK